MPVPRGNLVAKLAGLQSKNNILAGGSSQPAAGEPMTTSVFDWTERIDRCLEYCFHLYGLVPHTELLVASRYVEKLTGTTHQVDAIAAQCRILILDDTRPPPTVPGSAARKIRDGLGRLSQIEEPKRYETLYDVLGTSPKDGRVLQEEARSRAALANARRKFSDPRKSIIGELLSYATTFLAVDDPRPYLYHSVRLQLEPVCAERVRRGVHGAPLHDELQKMAVDRGMGATDASVLSIQIITSETGGLTAALDGGFSRCPKCGRMRLTVMPCACAEEVTNQDLRANSEGGTAADNQDWRALATEGIAVVRNLVLNVAADEKLPEFQFKETRVPPSSTWRQLIEFKNEYSPLELMSGVEIAHPRAGIDIRVRSQLAPVGQFMVVVASNAIVIPFSTLTPEEWAELVGEDGTILPMRIRVSGTASQDKPDGGRLAALLSNWLADNRTVRSFVRWL